MKPLLFMPSPREIPEVEESWDALPYDKYIVKNMLEKPAYQKGRDFFLEHEEYTHIVICPDDLIIDYNNFELLKRTTEENDLSNLCGVAMVDEESNAYACKPLGVPFSAMSGGSYYYRDKERNYKLLPDNQILEVGYTGFMIQFLERDLVETHLSFDGGCENNNGCMDLMQSREMSSNHIPYLVHTGAFFTHLRRRQYKETKEWIKHGDHTGYTIHLQKG